MKSFLRFRSWGHFFAILGWVFLYSASAVAATPPVVVTKKAQVEELFETVFYPARIQPRAQAQVLSEIDGIIRSVKAKLGDHLKSKQVLFTIERQDPLYQYAPFQVLSPIAGQLSQNLVTEGTQVAKGQPLATVTDSKNLRLFIELTASDVRRIRPSQKGELFSREMTEKETVVVRGVSPFLDPATGTATAELEFEKTAQNSAHAGLSGQVEFKLNRRQGIQVPTHALYYKENQPYLRLLEGKNAKLTPVVLGEKSQDRVEIKKGLTSGQIFIERTNGFVADGQEVQAEGS